MALPPITTAEVEYSVEAKKFIIAVPDIRFVAHDAEDWLAAEVRRKDTPLEDIRLRIEARVSRPISGIPGSLPRCILYWRGQRIRGLDYAVTHGRPGTAGGIVKGWHEHRWNEQEKDAYIVKATPEPTKMDLKSIFGWGLKKWNIEVKEEQRELNQ